MFVDEVKEEEANTCGVALLLAWIPDDIRAEIVATLDDPDRQSAAITRALIGRDYVIGVKTIERHRRRSRGTGCQCPS